MNLNKILLAVIIICFSNLLYSQEDTNKVQLRNYNHVKPGGIFISPVLGAEFPTSGFKSNSKYAFCFGVKLEYASTKIYPLIIGASFQYQKHEGSDDFKTMQLINTMNTKITSFGLSMDFLLNKYLKWSFTIPFAFAEVKMLSVKREVSPESNFPNLKSSDNTIAFGGGFGFTLYIFDIYTTYLSAKEYSTVSIKARFRFPLIKF